MTPVISERTRVRHELFGAWCAPIFSVLTAVGWLGLAHFIKPASASWSAARVADWFEHQHRMGVLWGCSIFLLSTCFLAVWTGAMAIQLWRLEGGSPLMAITQAMAGLAIVVIVVINCSLWLGASLRVDASGDVVRALNDAAWLGFLIAWPVLSLQMIATAVIAIRDRRPRPLFPRWLSQASLLGSVLLVTAGGAALTTHGAFSFSGVLGFYLPVAIWGAWLDTHAWFMRQESRRRLAALDAGPTPAGDAGDAGDVALPDERVALGR